MRLVTFNMRGGGSRTHWTQLVENTEADIAFVQETRAPSSFPPELLDSHDFSTGCWGAARHGKWGSALWLRRGGIGAIALSGPSWWAAGGVVNVGGEELFACSVHMDAARPGSYIRSANLFLDALADLRPKLPMVIAGDWNFTIGRRPADDGRTNEKGEDAFIDRLERDFGLVSAWSLHHPAAPLPQTLRFVKLPEIPYHCDGILLSASLRDRVRDVQVLSGHPWTKLSDHNPVVVDLSPRS